MTLDPAIATAADYADALMTARRAKNTLLLIIVLLLLAEIAIFFVAKYTTVLDSSIMSSGMTSSSATLTLTTPTSMPTLPAISSAPTTRATATVSMPDAMQYVTGLAVFLGLTLSILLTMVLYLIVKIMLVGRLIGVARLTGAFIWSLVVLLLLFPWQSFLGGAHFNDPSFKIPGVVYTWAELTDNAKFGMNGDHQEMARMVLHWARFVAWPLFAVILLLIIQVKSNRGLKQALGEMTIDDMGGTRVDTLPM